MKTVAWIALAVAVIALGAWFFTTRDVTAPAAGTALENSPESGTGDTPETSGVNLDVSGGGSVTVGEAEVKAFTVTGRKFSFTPAEIRVKKGDRVKIAFENEDGMHDWRLDEFNAATNILQTGEAQTIEFVADKAGTFEYYCSVGTHRAMGMKGKLIVSE